MTPHADRPGAGARTAEALFDAFLARHDDPSHPDFERYCDTHPGQATVLRKLARVWSAMAHVVDGLGSTLDEPDSDPHDEPPVTLATTGLDTTEPVSRSVSTGTSGGAVQAASDAASVFRLIDRLTDASAGHRRYRVMREVDKGGMGRILRVWDGPLRRPLAMKVMLRGTHRATSGSASADERQLARFLEEAQITGQLDHPGIVPVHELGLDSEGHLFFTMRLVRGRSLRTIFDLVHDQREGWTVARALSVLLKVCDALAYAHSKQVVHRDIKPANIMVGRFGETYVMDWGLAKVMGEPDLRDLRPSPAPETSSGPDSISAVLTDRSELEQLDADSPLLTRDGTVVGTPAYMSPEQASGESDDVGPTSDVYAVGALLYHLLTDQMPYVKPGEKRSPYAVLEAVREGPPTPISRLAPRTPPELAAICERAMARAPSDRYPDLGEMAEDLRAYIEGRVVRAYEAGSWAELRKWIERNSWSAAVAGLLLLLLAGALGWALLEREHALTNEQSAIRQGESERVARDEAVAALAAAQVAEHKATLAAHSEAEARLSADESRELAETRSEQLRQTSYRSFIGLAEGHLRRRELDSVARVLEQCAPEQRGWEWHHLKLRSDSSLSTLSGHRASVTGVAFSADGQRLVSASIDSSLRSWSVDGGEAGPGVDLGGGAAIALALHPMLPQAAVALVTGSPRQDLLLVDLENGAVLQRFSIRSTTGSAPERVTALAFDPAGNSLWAATDGNRAVSWRLSDGSMRALPRVHVAALTSLAFDRDGTRLVTGSEDGRAIVWEVSRGLNLADLDHDRQVVTAVAFDRAGELVASGALDGSVRVFDLTRRTLEQQRFVSAAHSGRVTSVAFGARDATLVTSSLDGSLALIDVIDGTRDAELLGHTAGVNAACPAPDGMLLASASVDGTVRLWDPGQLGARRMLAGHTETVRALAVPLGGGPVASSAQDGSVRVWDATTGLPLSVRELPAHWFAALAMAPGGQLLALAEPVSPGGDQYPITLWDLAPGHAPQPRSVQLPGHKRPVNAMAFASDGGFLASASDDGSVRIWDPGLGTQLAGHTRHGGWVQSLAVHPSRALVASGGEDEIVVLLDVTRNQVAWVADQLQSAVPALSFSHDGQTLALASGRGVLLLDTETRAPRGRLGDHADTVVALAHHPGQSRLASASRDGTIHLWDTRAGALLLTLRTPSAPRCMAFSPDGHRLLAAVGNDVLSFETVPPSLAHGARAEQREVLDRARAALTRLLDELVDPRAVIEALSADRALPISVRREALRQAEDFGSDADRLADAAFTIALDERAPAAQRAEALRMARAAYALRPNDPRQMSVLGLALMRMGAPNSAVGYTRTAYSENVRRTLDARGRYPTAWDALVLALAYHQVGVASEASTWHELGRTEMSASGRADPVSVALEAEVRRALRKEGR